MTWLDHHRQSEVKATEATEARRVGDHSRSVSLFGEAAQYEASALQLIDPAKSRTYGIVAVSVAALWFKAEELLLSESAAVSALTNPRLPPFAREELRVLLQHVWTATAKQQAGVKFVPGQVVVSVKGGAVVTGGAPLDLIVEKVQLVQAMFYRTIEHLKGMPLRTRGQPRKEILESCQPWLFQEAPGSYQFSVAIQEPKQKDFFREGVESSAVALHFLNILQAAVSDPENRLADLVPEREYRTTFLKLSRSLSPSPRSEKFSRLEVRMSGEPVVASVGEESRVVLNKAIRQEEESDPQRKGERIEIRGTLRALHLDRDWIDVLEDGKSVHVVGLKDSVDDLIGPLVNRQVLVRAIKQKRRTVFIDIEALD
jgi:hypothetical protein